MAIAKKKSKHTSPGISDMGYHAYHNSTLLWRREMITIMLTEAALHLHDGPLSDGSYDQSLGEMSRIIGLDSLHDCFMMTYHSLVRGSSSREFEFSYSILGAGGMMFVCQRNAQYGTLLFATFASVDLPEDGWYALNSNSRLVSPGGLSATIWHDQSAQVGKVPLWSAEGALISATTFAPDSLVLEQLRSILSGEATYKTLLARVLGGMPWQPIGYI